MINEKDAKAEETLSTSAKSPHSLGKGTWLSASWTLPAASFALPTASPRRQPFLHFKLISTSKLVPDKGGG